MANTIIYLAKLKKNSHITAQNFSYINYILNEITFSSSSKQATQWRSQDFRSRGAQKYQGGPTQTRRKLNEETSKNVDIVAAIKFCLIVHCKVQQNVKLNKRYNNGITYSQSATQRHINIYSINTDSDSRI